MRFHDSRCQKILLMAVATTAIGSISLVTNSADLGVQPAYASTQIALSAMKTPRYLQVATTGVYKINANTGKKVGAALKKGQQIRFVNQFKLKGVLYYQAATDKAQGHKYGIAASKLIELQFTNLPAAETLQVSKSGVYKIVVATGAKTGAVLSKGQRITFNQKITVNGVTYLRMSSDKASNHAYGIPQSDLQAIPNINVPVQILGINDFHGNVATADQKLTVPAITGSAATTDYTGSAALLAGYLNQYSKDFLNANNNGVSLRLEAGDMISASPAESSLIYDQPTLAALHAMHIQVGTLGNHEFDKGLAQLNTIMSGKDPIAHPTSEMDKDAAQFYKEYTPEQLSGGYQIVVANLVNKSDGKIPNGYKPYTILNEKTANGQTVKVGIIGVVTTETPNIALHQMVENYNFTNPAAAIVKYSKVLQAQGVNAIVVLGHTASDNTDNDPSQPVYGETADIIKEVDKEDPSNSVDLYVAGHSHTFTDGVVDKVRVVQAMSFGQAFDSIKATYNTKIDDFTATPSAKIVPVTDYSVTKNATTGALTTTYSKVQPDTAVADIVADAQDITDKISNVVIGKYDPAANYGTDAQGNVLNYLASSRTAGAAAFLPVTGLPDIQETNGDSGVIQPKNLGEQTLGTFITQAQWAMANQELNPQGVTVDFAITNTGGIRNSLLPDANGNITWGAAESVQPFRNVIQVVKMTGQQILNALNEQTYNSPNPSSASSGLYLQEYGIKYSVTTNPDFSASEHAYCSPYVVTSMTKLDGTPIELDKTYNVAINNFLRGGGDGFSAFNTNVTDIAGFQEDDTDVFTDYIKQLGTIPPASSFVQEKTFDATGTPLK